MSSLSFFRRTAWFAILLLCGPFRSPHRGVCLYDLLIPDTSFQVPRRRQTSDTCSFRTSFSVPCKPFDDLLLPGKDIPLVSLTPVIIGLCPAHRAGAVDLSLGQPPRLSAHPSGNTPFAIVFQNTDLALYMAFPLIAIIRTVSVQQNHSPTIWPPVRSVGPDSSQAAHVGRLPEFDPGRPAEL